MNATIRSAPGMVRRRLRTFAASCLALPVLVGLAAPCEAKEQRRLTVADAIGTTRINQLTVSPDGSRYVAMLVRGDLEHNGVWIELISGGLESLDSAAQVATVARFFTTAVGPARNFDLGASELTFQIHNSLRWLDAGERVAMRFGDGVTPIQVVAVNVRTGKIEYLTRSGADVLSFDADRSGALIYVARHAHPQEKSARLMNEGFNVTNRDVYTLLMGAADGYSLREYQSDIEIFVAAAQDAPSRAVTAGTRSVHRNRPYAGPKFSPAADRVILAMTPVEVPDEWDRYTGPHFPLVLKDWRKDPVAGYGVQLQQLFVVDVATAAARPLWNAPTGNAQKTDFTWSPDGRSVLVSATYVPVRHADAAGMSGWAVADVDVATGRFRTLPVPAGFAHQSLRNPQWQPDGIVTVSAGEITLRFRKSGSKWKFLEQAPRSQQDAGSAPIEVRIRQDLNTPPSLYAVESSSGRERMILDPNPGLATQFRLGRVEHVTWPDAEGRTWSGLLYYPVNHAPDRRFPLVVQTHGHAPVTDFSLYGNGLLPGLGPGYSAFAAQPLANLDIAVLQVEDKRVEEMSQPREAMIHVGGYDSGVEYLVKKGLVDRDKVGIMGYSRTGWYIEQALTQSDLPYAAAVSSDVTDCSYMTYTMMPPYCGRENGAAPFGEDLEAWLERAPAFNVQRIYAALRMEKTTGPLPAVLARWELFSRMRDLDRAVELHVVPDIAHGSHAVQNPAQVLATKQGAVDWFAFWLAGYEDPAPARTEQYIRWRKLREKRAVMLQQPRPPLLDWEATPRNHGM